MENLMSKRIVVVNDEEKIQKAHRDGVKVIAEKLIFSDKERDSLANRVRSIKNEDILYKAYFFSEDKVYIEILKVEN